MTQNGKATSEKTTFSRETAVSITIRADAAIVWQLLTNAADYPRWNTTIISIEGKIAKDKRITLKSVLAPKRVFKLTIKEAEQEKRLAWGDGQGIRVFTMNDNGDGTIDFSMKEKIGGPLFPLFSKYIPSFDQSFEQFAGDLRKEAEMIQNTHK